MTAKSCQSPRGGELPPSPPCRVRETSRCVLPACTGICIHWELQLEPPDEETYSQEQHKPLKAFAEPDVQNILRNVSVDLSLQTSYCTGLPGHLRAFRVVLTQM